MGQLGINELHLGVGLAPNVDSLGVFPWPYSVSPVKSLLISLPGVEWVTGVGIHLSIGVTAAKQHRGAESLKVQHVDFHVIPLLSVE